jgi:hypothetical protein
MQVVAAERETTLASAEAQLQQNRGTLEGARSWQSQAEEKAKEAEQLGGDLADKATSLAMVGGSSVRSKVRTGRRRLSSSKSGLSSRRLRPPSSMNAQPERKRRAILSGSTLRSRRHRPPSRSRTRRSRGSPVSWSKRACPRRTYGRTTRRRMLSSSSCSRQLPPRVPPSSRRRSRLRVSCFPCLSPVGLIHLGSAPNSVRTFVFRPTDGARDDNDLGAGHPDGLQLIPTGAGRAAGRRPRGVPGH